MHTRFQTLTRAHTHLHPLKHTIHAATRGNDDANEIQLLSSSQPQTSRLPPSDVFRVTLVVTRQMAELMPSPSLALCESDSRLGRHGPPLADPELPTPTSLPPVKPQPGARAVNPATGAVTPFTPVPAVSPCGGAAYFAAPAVRNTFTRLICHPLKKKKPRFQSRNP